MRQLTIGVPSGVGDVYWCLTKVQALREHYGAGRVSLRVRASLYDRACDWARMVDFVDEALIQKFEPRAEVLERGVGYDCHGLDMVLWPNAVVDRGEHLSTWLPEHALDLSFPIKTPDMGAPRIIVYMSSVGADRNWMRQRGARWWRRAIVAITQELGPVTLVGAAWDLEFSTQLQTPVEDLVGKTTLPQLAGLLRNARVVIGLICGVTIVANHFRTPTVAVYPEHKFPPSFARAWVAADAPYMPVPLASVQQEPQELARLGSAVIRSAAPWP